MRLVSWPDCESTATAYRDLGAGERMKLNCMRIRIFLIMIWPISRKYHYFHIFTVWSSHRSAKSSSVQNAARNSRLKANSMPTGAKCMLSASNGAVSSTWFYVLAENRTKCVSLSVVIYSLSDSAIKNSINLVIRLTAYRKRPLLLFAHVDGTRPIFGNAISLHNMRLRILECLHILHQ